MTQQEQVLIKMGLDTRDVQVNSQQAIQSLKGFGRDAEGAGQQAGRGVEFFNLRGAEMRKLLHGVTSDSGIMGLAMRAAIEPETLGLAAIVVGYEAIKTKIQEVTKAADEMRDRIIADNVAIFESQLTAAQKLAKDLNEAATLQDRIRDGAFKASDEVGIFYKRQTDELEKYKKAVDETIKKDREAALLKVAGSSDKTAAVNREYDQIQKVADQDTKRAELYLTAKQLRERLANDKNQLEQQQGLIKERDASEERLKTLKGEQAKKVEALKEAEKNFDEQIGYKRNWLVKGWQNIGDMTQLGLRKLGIGGNTPTWEEYLDRGDVNASNAVAGAKGGARQISGQTTAEEARLAALAARADAVDSDRKANAKEIADLQRSIQQQNAAVAQPLPYGADLQKAESRYQTIYQNALGYQRRGMGNKESVDQAGALLSQIRKYDPDFAPFGEPKRKDDPIRTIAEKQLDQLTVIANVLKE